MSLPNEILVGRYNRLAQKFLSMKGAISMGVLDPQLTFVIGCFYGAENRYLEGWDLFGFSKALSAPGAGNQLFATLRNPVGSNVVAVVTRAAMYNPAAVDTGRLMIANSNTASTTDQPTVNSVPNFDKRGRPSSTIVSSDNSGAAPTALAGYSNLVQQSPLQTTSGIGSNELMRAGDEIPLLPGSSLTLQNSTLNSSINMCFWWRERFLEESERT